MSSATITHLARYPVKGLSADLLETVTLAPGETMPLDRIYAIENGASRFDPNDPKPLPKTCFLMLMRNERLASLESRFDPDTHALTLLRAGRQVAQGILTTKLGRQLVEQFLAAYMKTDLRGAPRILTASGHSFSDVEAKCLHVISLASLRDLERRIGRPLDPRRFRANVHIDGLPPWAENDWIGKRLRMGGVEVEGIERTGRCDATSVDPATAQRDIAVPKLLLRELGHSDFGVYVRVAGAGTIAVGDPVAPPAD